MSAKTKDQIKDFFQTGDSPTEAQFIDFIDSYVDKSGPIGQIETAASGMTTGIAAASAGAGELWGASKALSFLGVTVYTTALASAVATQAVAGAYTTTAQASAAASDAIVSAYATTAQSVAGTATRVLMDPVLTKNAVLSLNPFGNNLLHIQDQKAANTAGGASTSGSWQTRTLNTVVTNQITGSSLATNQITLPSGTYYIDADTVFHQSNSAKAKLYNITDGADTLLGINAYSTTSNNDHTHSQVSGQFTITSTKVFEIQYRVGNSTATNGLGVAGNFGVVEVYTDVKIWKLS